MVTQHTKKKPNLHNDYAFKMKQREAHKSISMSKTFGRCHSQHFNAILLLQSMRSFFSL